MNKKEGRIDVLRFDAVKIPQPTESQEKSNDKFVLWGKNNLYPNYLLQLYAESAIHSSIINSKANYIIGDGLQYENGSKLKLKVNASDTFDEFVSKIVKDYLIFNYFAVEVVYNKFLLPIEYHFVPAHKVRTNNDKSKFWVSQNWQLNDKPIIFSRWKNQPDDSLSKIFFFDGYTPTISNVYPQAEYHGSIPSIVLESEIKKFNINNIQNHFSVSSLITFFNGVASEELKAKAVNDIRQSYTGVEGKKIMLDFQPSNGKGAEIQSLSPGDWDKAYALIAQSVKEDIMQGHSVTTPMLFGVMTEGKLGGSTELDTGYEIFQNTYVRNKRNELLSALNVLFANSELVNGTLEFAERQLFAGRVSDDIKSKIYTINEVRAEMGLPALPNGDTIINEMSKVTSNPITTPIQNQSHSTDTFELSETDFDKIQNLGISIEEFEFIQEGEFVRNREDFNRVELHFETSQEIADYLIQNNISGMSVNDLKVAIRKDIAINISSSELKDILKNLNDSGILKIDITDTGINVSKPENPEPSRKIEVVYSYEVRPGYGSEIERNTRPFCRRLIENNKFYTRADIQTMSSIFGYDIFQYGGGYYRNPKTHELTSHCRHWFKSMTVSRKVR